MKPGIPREKPICRPFYKLMKFGFPASLSSRTMPRCKVGSGKRAAIYMWKDAASCRFLGGRLIRQPYRVCKVGRPHSWKRVVRCIKGPIISGKGFNYGRRSNYHHNLKSKVISGTYDWMHDGKNVNGIVTFSSNGVMTVLYSGRRRTGRWKTLSSNTIYAVFNGVAHKLQFRGTGASSAVLLTPKRSPKSKMKRGKNLQQVVTSRKYGWLHNGRSRNGWVWFKSNGVMLHKFGGRLLTGRWKVLSSNTI